MISLSRDFSVLTTFYGVGPPGPKLTSPKRVSTRYTNTCCYTDKQVDADISVLILFILLFNIIIFINLMSHRHESDLLIFSTHPYTIILIK